MCCICFDNVLLLPQGGDTMTIAEKIKEARLSKKIQLNELAQMLEVSAETVRRWENGVSTPYLKHQRRIEQVLEITL